MTVAGIVWELSYKDVNNQTPLNLFTAHIALRPLPVWEI